MKRLIILFLLLFATAANAGTTELTLAWDKNTEADLAGYRLYMSATSGNYAKGVSSANYVKEIIVGASGHPDRTTHQFSGSEGQRIYFVLTAFDVAGNESGFSNEVSFVFPDVTPPRPPSGLMVALQKIIAWLMGFLRG